MSARPWLVVFEYRIHLIPGVIAWAGVVDTASQTWGLEKCEKDSIALGGTNVNVGFAIAASEKNFHGKKTSTEIEVHYRKQMEVISDLAREYRHVTTVPVNLFIEIHWLDGIAQGMYLVQTSGYFIHYDQWG